MNVPGEHRPPPALQAERTTLAWLRTGLVCAALVALSLRLAETDIERVVGLVVGGAVAVTGLTAAWLRMGDLRHVVEVRPVADRLCPALLTGAVVLTDLLVLYFLLT